MRWLKVDEGGNALGGATFLVTGASYPSGVDVLDDTDGVVGPGLDQDPDPGEFQLNDLELGSYDIQETVAPDGYDLDPDIETVELTLENPSNADGGQNDDLPVFVDRLIHFGGRFTGGGSVFLPAGAFPGTGIRVTHGFQLHCAEPPQEINNRLQINWAHSVTSMSDNRFHLLTLEDVFCLDDPLLDEEQPNADVDTIIGAGVGRFSGTVLGVTYRRVLARVEFTFTDDGEPANDGPGGDDDDLATYRIYLDTNGNGSFDGGIDTLVLTTDGSDAGLEPEALPISFGNHQAHREVTSVLTPPEVAIQSSIDSTLNKMDNPNLSPSQILSLNLRLQREIELYEGSMSIAALNTVKPEGLSGNTPFTFSVTRTGDLSLSANVSYAVTGSSANPSNAEDFGGVMPSGSVHFAAGEHTTTLTINVKGDSVVEKSEGFRVTLSNPPAGMLLGTSFAAGQIQNDDALVSISSTNTVRAEGHSGSTAFTFMVTRTGYTGAASVRYAVTGSGAYLSTANDFVGGVLPSGLVSFGTGETAKSLTIYVQSDTLVEKSEGFRVTLSSPVGMLIETCLAAGQIQNDDASVSISPTNATQAEGNSGSTAFTFTVTRTGYTGGAASVRYAVSGTGANPVSASDFVGGVLPSALLNFAAGETAKTITIYIQGDTVVEASEGFLVTLSSPSPGLVLETALATARIQNDDEFFANPDSMDSLP